MAGAAELFTVCNSCGQQVSAFVTECPYCGTRLRQRAPRLDRKDGDLEALLRAPDEHDDAPPVVEDDTVVPLRGPRRVRGPKPQRAAAAPRAPRRAPRVRRPRPRADAGDRRPWATIAIVLLSLLTLPLLQLLAANDLQLVGGLTDQPLWRPVVAALTYGDTWHALAVLAGLGVFGWLWERRAGAVGTAVVVLLFLVAGVGGLVASAAVDPGAVHTGGVGAATALATAWIVAELRARARGESLDGDLLGATVLLAVPLATSVVVPAGAPVAAAVGVLVGAAAGLGLSAAGR
ncbi:rhomboid family intramembrane serine protease [Patulibacter sp. SYSU D01012]|uniref:rhomboid family intramembrane serine protease n=1 Tax=Patulibacter sp. SYSU D01012 TaxID=2817381 RepID=UPI001B307D8D|nr:rhomboid family intramembrane serine protease [Patulibacter sp. SYSU D01012]